MSWAGLWTTDPACRSAGARVATALRSATPTLLFGLRLWAAVCLALYIAFWLQLDNAYWAGTSAAVVCQPSLGASLRKAWFRMVGAMAIVVLTACFPQDRIGFLLGLALWGAACGLVATLLRNFASYAAALAGLTAAVIASDELGAIGGANGGVFMLAVTRASEICIGIICAGVVLAATDFGGARQRLAAELATISAEIAGRLAGTFLLAGTEQSKTRQSATSSAASPDSTRSSTKPLESPRTFVLTRRACRRQWQACSQPYPAGGRQPLTSNGCHVTRVGVRPISYSGISDKNCLQCRCKVRLHTGRSILPAGARSALRQCGL
jgi:uncharacterized membrane protein YccC